MAWRRDIQGRSGRVALPRTNEVPAIPAMAGLTAAEARRAARAAGTERKREVAMMLVVE